MPSLIYILSLVVRKEHFQAEEILQLGDYQVVTFSVVPAFTL